MIVKINGIEVTTVKNTKSIEDAIDERSTAQFGVIDAVGVEYSKGQQVAIYDGTDKLFAGIIEQPLKTKDDDTFIHAITCIDWHYLADKKTARKAYQNTLIGDIVRDLISTYLDEEGITIGKIEDGGIAAEVVFNYIPVTDALNALAEKAGYWWKIDADKKLYFVSRATNIAPFTITQADTIKGSIEIENNNPYYRNKQYIIGGEDVTDPQTETKVGDGEAKAFVVGFPIAKVPTVEVNRNSTGWVAESVGIKGLEEGKAWYWSKGQNTITQDNSGTVLAKDIDKVRITYQGQFPIVVIVERKEEIDNYKLKEGGTGIVEAVDIVAQTNNSESAFEEANQKLDKYGVISRRVKFKTWEPGLETGHLLTINFTDYDVNNEEMLIESIVITEEDNETYYIVSAVAGPNMGSWAKLFYAMASKGQDFIIRENIREDEVIVLLESFSKTWLEIDAPNIFKIVRPGIGLKPGFKPMFKITDKVKYIAWFNGVTELGRKRITKQSGADSSNIQSISFLGMNDANETITDIGWIGGWQATDDIGTGILLDKQPYSKVKTSLEALQLVKNDIKGW